MYYLTKGDDMKQVKFKAHIDTEFGGTIYKYATSLEAATKLVLSMTSSQKIVRRYITQGKLVVWKGG